MRLLLLDTCGAAGSVALAESAAVVASEVLPGRSASERLVPVVRSLLEGRGWRLGELAAIVVVHGPGSFTGVRIGLSAAKGLSEAVGVPLVAVSRLAVLAGLGGGGCCVALDAGRGEFYFGDYRREPTEALLTLEEVREAVGAGEIVVCEAKVAEALKSLGRDAKDEVPGGVVAAPPTLGDEAAEGGAPGRVRVPWALTVRMVMEPVAGDALGIALERVAAGQFDDAAVVDANYLRRTEGLFGRPVAG